MYTVENINFDMFFLLPFFLKKFFEKALFAPKTPRVDVMAISKAFKKGGASKWCF